MAEGLEVERVGGRRKSEYWCSEGGIWRGCLGLGATARTGPRKEATFVGRFGLWGDVRIGIAHGFIVMRHIMRISARVEGRYALWKGTSGQCIMGVRIRAENG